MHGFGVNFIDTLVLKDNCFLVASGGDDQNIAVNLFEKTGPGLYKISDCTTYGHSSCIKGLLIYRKVVNNTEEIRLCSSGYDQRFKVWKLTDNREMEQLKLEKVSSQRHCLSDMNWICKAGDKAILVGQGI